MTLFTPARYWRIGIRADQCTDVPISRFTLPADLTRQQRPPRAGEGLVLASYDAQEQIGNLHWIGYISQIDGAVAQVEWRPCIIRIRVETPFGRSKWCAGHFGFAPSKHSEYGLHELWHRHFPHMAVRTRVSVTTTRV